ncbi:hypothetical protein STIAU_0222 [Stigmatella aurantiaca DW4/3-1]|uniref:Uncharacterized protein n=1 Tax=Stigmatella aurantiaca (strain DW4/3-1) TaxID=378806 RepID=Q08UJ7_STIAD|nr:hypothetical protein STIAU_0222 [Stigmatella aurantiaca DW4/3-1]
MLALQHRIPTRHAPHHVHRATRPRQRFGRHLVGRVRQQHGVRPRIQREPHRRALLALLTQVLDEPQRARVHVAERRIRRERRGVHAPSVALTQRPQPLQILALDELHGPGNLGLRVLRPRGVVRARLHRELHPIPRLHRFLLAVEDGHHHAQLRPVPLGEALHREAVRAIVALAAPPLAEAALDAAARRATAQPGQEARRLGIRGQSRRGPGRHRQRREARRAARQPRRRREVPARHHPRGPQRAACLRLHRLQHPENPVPLAALGRVAVDLHLIRAGAKLHRRGDGHGGERQGQARLMGKNERVVPLPPILHQGDVGMRQGSRFHGSPHNARGPASWLVKHRTPSSSSFATAGSGSKKRPMTAPPSPPAPVSFAPRAPRPRSRYTISSSGGEDNPSAASSPWLTFIASPSASRSPCSTAFAPSDARVPICLNSRVYRSGQRAWRARKAATVCLVGLRSPTRATSILSGRGLLRIRTLPVDWPAVRL